jgi:flagellum-specific peptidoglycan hydrolase FlgJ
MTKADFVMRMMSACAKAKNQGVKFNEAVVCAQAALESNWGRSGLCVRANNLFGIKAGRSWRGKTLDLPTKEWSKSRGWYRTTSHWCSWSDWSDCIVYYSEMLHRLSWFRDALGHLYDSDAFLEALLPEIGQPGWATDPRYASKVRAVGARIERLGGPKWS